MSPTQEALAQRLEIQLFTEWCVRMDAHLPSPILLASAAMSGGVWGRTPF